MAPKGNPSASTGIPARRGSVASRHLLVAAVLLGVELDNSEGTAVAPIAIPVNDEQRDLQVDESRVRRSS